MYRVFINDGYITSFAEDINGNVTEEEYLKIKRVIDNRPTPPQGYDYRLKENLEWELYELPPVVEGIDE